MARRGIVVSGQDLGLSFNPFENSYLNETQLGLVFVFNRFEEFNN